MTDGQTDRQTDGRTDRIPMYLPVQLWRVKTKEIVLIQPRARLHYMRLPLDDVERVASAKLLGVIFFRIILRWICMLISF